MKNYQSVPALPLPLPQPSATSQTGFDTPALDTNIGDACHAQLEVQQLIAEAVIKITEKERTRLGQELHDNVNQLLACAVLFLDTIHPDTDPEKNAKEKSRQFLVTAVEEIRKLSKALVTPQLTGSELIQSIRSLITDIELASGLRINFEHDLCETKISSGKRLAIYRILQEQLKNILKHSQASEVSVRLISTVKKIQLTVEDNGIGCNCNEAAAGIGLSNIRDRARFYGGQLEITTSPGQGFRLTVTLTRKKPVKQKTFSTN